MGNVTSFTIIEVLINLVYIFLGSVCTFYIDRFVKQYKDKKLQEKFSVSGKYITQYEDIESGEIVIKKALAELTQKGHKVTGKTFFNKDKCWKLNCEIHDLGRSVYITGGYESANPDDGGMGSIFLHMGKGRVLKGLWSGYENDSTKVISGNYEFTPILGNYEICELTERHVSQCIELADNQLGEIFFTNDNIKNAIADDKPYHCFVAVLDGEVIGFAFGCILSMHDFIELSKIEVSSLPNCISMRHVKNIGILKTVVISNEYNSRGVGYALVEKICGILRGQSQILAAIVCTDHQLTTIENILLHNKFKKYDGIVFENTSKNTAINSCLRCQNGNGSEVVFFSNFI